MKKGQEHWMFWALIIGGIGVMVWNGTDSEKHEKIDVQVEEMRLWKQFLTHHDKADKILLMAGLLAKASEHCDNANQNRIAREYSIRVTLEKISTLPQNTRNITYEALDDFWDVSPQHLEIRCSLIRHIVFEDNASKTKD